MIKIKNINISFLMHKIPHKNYYSIFIIFVVNSIPVVIYTLI